MRSEIEALVGVGGKKADGLVLKNEIADAVEDRLAFVDFNAHGEVRAMADENVGAFVDRLVRELGHEVGGLFQFRAAARGEQTGAAEFVAVDADDDPVGLAARFADPSQVVLQVALVGFGRDRETFAGNVAIAEQAQLRGLGVANFLVAVKMFARSLVALFKAELAADAFQLLERRGIDAVAWFESRAD